MPGMPIRTCAFESGVRQPIGFVDDDKLDVGRVLAGGVRIIAKV
jgi:hypothetical protein